MAEQKEKLFERSEFFSFRPALLIFSECGVALILVPFYQEKGTNAAREGQTNLSL